MFYYPSDVRAVNAGLLSLKAIETAGERPGDQFIAKVLEAVAQALRHPHSLQEVAEDLSPNREHTAALYADVMVRRLAIEGLTVTDKEGAAIISYTYPVRARLTLTPY